MSKMTSGNVFILLLSILWMPAKVHAAESDIMPFRKNYIVGGLTRNHPIQKTYESYRSGPITLALEFWHAQNQNWILGIGGQFKSFTPRGRHRNLSLATGYHQSLYALRLYHPTYLLFGPKVMFVIPTLNRRIPLQENDEYANEIALGGTIQVAHFWSNNVVLTIRYDRWRGSKTSRLQATETAVGLGVGF